MKALIKLLGITYRRDEQSPMIDNLSLDIFAGDFLSLSGVPGSGKTELLRIFALLDFPQKGSFITDIFDHYENGFGDIIRIRTSEIATVFLEEALTKNTNAEKLGGQHGISIRQVDRKLLQKRLDEIESCPPRLVLVDEPSGLIDPRLMRYLMDTLHRLADERGVAIIMATNNPEIASETDRTLYMQNGKIVESKERPKHRALAKY